VARVYGRAVDSKGSFESDTVSQESYVEDRFHVPPDVQVSLAELIERNGADRLRMPRALERLLVGHAYLGQLDVNPSGAGPDSKSDLKQCEFWIERVDSGDDAVFRVQVEGTTNVSGRHDPTHRDIRGDGRDWSHEVELAWEGLIELEGRRIQRLLLVARGSEKLKWGNTRFAGESDVSRLPAGRPIDLACPVRYGIIGEPPAGDD
jgi:hypothetical protein